LFLAQITIAVKVMMLIHYAIILYFNMHITHSIARHHQEHENPLRDMSSPEKSSTEQDNQRRVVAVHCQGTCALTDLLWFPAVSNQGDGARASIQAYEGSHRSLAFGIVCFERDHT
jgi:hypothetical protein